MSETVTPPAEVDPRRSPSYPQRVHIRERAHWRSVLAEVDAKVAEARKRAGTGTGAAKTLAQLAGARDQVADAVARLPMEVGEMYAEDRHRLEEAIAALDRLAARV